MDTKNIVPTNWFRKKDQPFRNERHTFWSDIERIFENIADSPVNYQDYLPNFLKTVVNDNMKIVPRVDVYETDKEYLMEVEMPGVAEENIDISVADGKILTIRAKKESKRDEKDRNYYMIECSYGSFERKIELPSNAEPDKIDASFKDGVINIKLPKKKSEQQSVKKVKIGKSK